ncbi:MAG: VOC family protein [Clostridiales bacterium]|jgi:catechol 2,3-dioxygenase-like lactoylglutathione lyase family enzyme|nr:VOC family protein [Clostridiales bacterium]
MIEGIKIGDIAIDCKEREKLRDFYADLLGWEKRVMFGCPAVVSAEGFTLIFMETDCEYCPPVWPDEPGTQQKQMHFNFEVANLARAVAEAEGLGAKRSASQFGGEHFVVMLDPEGHPFCLCAQHKA